MYMYMGHGLLVIWLTRNTLTYFDVKKCFNIRDEMVMMNERGEIWL